MIIQALVLEFSESRSCVLFGFGFVSVLVCLF